MVELVKFLHTLIVRWPCIRTIAVLLRVSDW